jgi:hypothetical protein
MSRINWSTETENAIVLCGMKWGRLFMLILMGSAATTAQVLTNTPSAPGSSNKLAIYLLADKPGPKLDELKLESTPILADNDFVSYNTNTHEFSIKADSAKRLCHQLKGKMGIHEPQVRGSGVLVYGCDWGDTPFVLEASGERVYEGVFSTTMSSMSYIATPVLKTWKTFIDADATNDVAFSSEFASIDTSAIEGLVRQHPGVKSFGWEPLPDPRDDKRIAAAVEKLFGHRSRNVLP